MLRVIYAPGVSNLLQLATFSCAVVFADITEGCSWVEVTAAYRALDAVLHGPPQISKALSCGDLLHDEAPLKCISLNAGLLRIIKHAYVMNFSLVDDLRYPL